jgi:hypothetical protein
MFLGLDYQVPSNTFKKEIDKPTTLLLGLDGHRASPCTLREVLEGKP